MGFVCVGVGIASAGCGGRVEGDGSAAGGGGGGIGTANAAKEATALYVADPKSSCATPARVDGVATELRPAGFEETAVVELTVAEECTNLGGQWLLGRDVRRASNKYWLGGHGCRTVAVANDGSARYGVIVYVPTDSIGSIPPSVCVAFPGNAPGTVSASPTRVRALATFATLVQAEAFEQTLR